MMSAKDKAVCTLSILTVGFDEFTPAICHVIDPSMLNLLTSTKNALPSSDRVGAHYRALALSVSDSIFCKVCGSLTAGL
jgi:hypothetical protein